MIEFSVFALLVGAVILALWELKATAARDMRRARAMQMALDYHREFGPTDIKSITVTAHRFEEFLGPKPMMRFSWASDRDDQSAPA